MRLLPVVQLKVRVGDGHSRVLQLANRASNVCRGHVIPRIIIEANHEDALVMTAGGKAN